MPALSETRGGSVPPSLLPELDRVPKPSITFNVLKPEQDKGHDSIFSDAMAIADDMDGMFITRRGKKTRCASVAAVSVFLATAAIDIATTEILHEPVPTPLIILTAVSGATVALMSVGFYLKDKIDHIQNFRQNHRKSSSITS
jgi:hypothetical protein